MLSDGLDNLQLVDEGGLRTLKARPAFGKYLRELWKMRHFIVLDARARSFADGRGTFLGVFWVILNPAIQVALYALVFGVFLKTSRGLDNFIGFLVIGVVYFGFITAGLNAGALLVQRNRGLISSFNFPKAAVAISATLRGAFDGSVSAVLAVVFALLFQIDRIPSWTIALVIPIYVLMQIFIAGTIFVVARATAFVPDLRSLISVVTRILFFTSGVFWPVERFVHHPTLLAILNWNPVHQFLAMIRLSVLDGEVPSLTQWLYLTVWSFGLLAFGLWFFWRAEHKYASIK
ncbi:ABC transporter permease [Corynebacterium accolens]|uniref:Transport permease protein n=1 Tax=Corynebacterium accolens TaxID=38284 RepID=A0A2A4AJV0_9CORY|nr:ABC transporter permease [Corynebacterium accolens]